MLERPRFKSGRPRKCLQLLNLLSRLNLHTNAFVGENLWKRETGGILSYLAIDLKIKGQVDKKKLAILGHWVEKIRAKITQLSYARI